MGTPTLTRRTFLRVSAAAGGGLLISGFVPGTGRDAAAAGIFEPNIWVKIAADGTVTMTLTQLEMGQGVMTSMPMLVAEELECDWSKVTVENPTPGQNLARNRTWGDFNTVGSRAIRTSQEYVRKGGAAAREMLKQAAAYRKLAEERAKRLNLPPVPPSQKSS